MDCVIFLKVGIEGGLRCGLVATARRAGAVQATDKGLANARGLLL
jgi:hypothetical protein